MVGDIVEFTVLDDSSNDKSKNKKAVIESIEDRKVYIKRPKIANITQIVFVVSSKSPKPDLLMLDKQLAFAEFLGINALIVLNKIDLDDKKEFENIKTLYENIGYKVIETGAKERIGVLNVKKNEESATFFELEAAKTDYFHIDVMDGKFVEKNTYDKMMEYASYIRRISNLPLDVHLMVEDVKEAIDDFLAVEPNIITFHLEAVKDEKEIFDIIIEKIYKVKL